MERVFPEIHRRSRFAHHRLHRHRRYHIAVHRRGDNDTDAAQRIVAAAARLYGGSGNARHAAARIFIVDYVPAAGGENRLQHRFRNRDDARYRANRRPRHHGGQFRQLSDTPQNRRHGGVHSRVGRIQYGSGAFRRILGGIVHKHHSGIALHLRTAILLHRILHLVHHHQIVFLRIRHQQRGIVFRLQGTGRRARSRESQHRFGGGEQRYDTSARCHTH